MARGPDSVTELVTKARLDELIERHRGEAEAKAFRAYKPTRAEIGDAAKLGRSLLTAYPDMHGACMLMSSQLACRLQRTCAGPVYVAAGELYIGKARIFGAARDQDWARALRESNAAWDGHAWIVIGHWLMDVSLFRTSRSPRSPPLLAEHVRKTFGDKIGLLACTEEVAEEDGLSYRARYILTEEQITALARGAAKFLPQPDGATAE